MSHLSDKKLIILDRDGVINQDSPNYIKSADEWLPIAGSIAAIKLLNDHHKIVTVATNQSGIGRGLFDLNALEAMHEKFYQLLQQNKAHIDALLYCPHIPDDVCTCRKPKSGMVQQLLRQFNIAAKDAVMIGDSLRDLQAAEAVGVSAVLVKTGKGESTLTKHKIKVPVYDNLLAFAREICDE